jgi:hypothetical protein
MKKRKEYKPSGSGGNGRPGSCYKCIFCGLFHEEGNLCQKLIKVLKKKGKENK